MPRPWRAQFSMLWRRTSFIAGAGFGAEASFCSGASCPNVGMPKATIMAKAMLTTLRVDSALLSFMVGFSRRSEMQNLVHTNAKHWTQKTTRAKRKSRPMRSSPKNIVGLTPIIRKRPRLGEIQNLVHTNAKLTGTVEKVFVHE